MEEQSKINIGEKSCDTKFMDGGMTELLQAKLGENNDMNNNAHTENTQTNDNEHSLGKFKSVDELQKAYKSLEAEFTKRSQKLAELENPTKLSWETQVDNFLSKNPQAKNHAELICKEFMMDEDLQNKENCLDIAYNRALEKLIIDKSSLATNDEFLDKYIYSNPKITSKIISLYLSNIKNSQPFSLMGDGGDFAISPKVNPKTIKDCSSVIEKMFN